jgi:hypothetical protein
VVAVFDQLLGSNQSKTAGASLVISPASKTVTVGKTIFVAFGSDDVGSAFGVTDDLGNTYTQVGTTTVNAGAVKTQLWAAPVTVGGSITSITIAWTTSITAKAAVAGEYSNFGTRRLTSGSTGTSVAFMVVTNTFFNGELWIGAIAFENPNTTNITTTNTGTPSQSTAEAAQDGTTGGGAASNIEVALQYILINADSTLDGALAASAGGAAAGAGAIYNAAVTSFPLLDDSDDCAFLIVDY